MTRFDAPPPSRTVLGSASRAAYDLLATRFGLVIAATGPTVLAILATTALLCIGTAVPLALRQAFVSSPLLVFMTPTASRADVEALGPKLTALPEVASATVRTKEEALAALVSAGLPPPADGRNPLPDVWTVTLHGAGPIFLSEAFAARDGIRAFPMVDQVRFDETWTGSLDRFASAWARFGVGWLAGLSGCAAVSLLCIYFLFGRALGGAPSGQPAAVATLVIVGSALVIVSALVAYALCLAILHAIDVSAWPAVKPIAATLGLNLVRSIAAPTAVCLVLMAFGVIAGRHVDRAAQSL